MLDHLPDPSIRCPYSGFDKKTGTFTAACRDIVTRSGCPKFIRVDGENPQTGERIHKFCCVDSVQHLLLIEHRAALDGVQKAIESRGNEASELLSALLMTAVGRQPPTLPGRTMTQINECVSTPRLPATDKGN